MTKYRELQKIVYSIIFPEGIPIEEGCEMKFLKERGVDGWERDSDNYKVIRKHQYGFNGYERGKINTVICNTSFLGFHEVDLGNGEWKILGKPLQGFDILRAIKLKVKLEDYETIDLSIYGDLIKHSWSGYEPPDKEDLAELDLSLSIQNQTPDTIQKLINLIK